MCEDDLESRRTVFRIDRAGWGGMIEEGGGWRVGVATRRRGGFDCARAGLLGLDPRSLSSESVTFCMGLRRRAVDVTASGRRVSPSSIV